MGAHGDRQLLRIAAAASSKREMPRWARRSVLVCVSYIVLFFPLPVQRHAPAHTPALTNRVVCKTPPLTVLSIEQIIAHRRDRRRQGGLPDYPHRTRPPLARHSHTFSISLLL